MPSPFSRYLHTPLERATLLSASGAFLLHAVAGKSERESAAGGALDDDSSLDFAVLACAGLALCSVESNTYSVHSGEYPQRDWRDWDPHLFEALFRFDRADIPRLRDALCLPAVIRTRDRKVFTSDQAITLLLLRFHGYDLHELHRMTGVRPSGASALLSHVYDFVWDKWYVSLLASDLKRWAPEFPEWSSAVFEKTERRGFDNTPVFVDGTLRGICRPAHSQDIWFNCHHWMHGVLWQALTAPNGLVIDLAGPMNGRRHDRHILKKSKLLSRFAAANVSAGFAPNRYRIYADAGYWISLVLQAAYHRAKGFLAADKRALNRVMSTVRILVEWGFGRVLALWPYFSFTPGQQLGRVPVAKMYVTAVLLTNAHCCLYGNQTSEAFGLSPPSLEDYFGQAPPQPAGRAQAWDNNVV